MLVRGRSRPLFSHFTSDEITFDTEGTGLIPYGSPAYWGYYPARPFAFAFCDADGHTEYFRWAVDPATRRVMVGSPAEQDILRRLTVESHFTVVGHHIAYDFRMTKALGFPIRHQNVIDTMVLAHVVTAGDELSYALKPLSLKYLDYPDDDEHELEDAVADARRKAKANGWLIAGGKKEVERGDNVVFAGNKPVKADYWLVPSPDFVVPLGGHVPIPSDAVAYTGDLVQKYAVGDVIRAAMLKQLWWRDLESEPRLMKTYRREMALFWSLRKMEERGTRVYPDHTHRLIRWYQRYMVKMQQSASNHGGAGMNFMSPKQLVKKFYVEKGYEPMFMPRKRRNKETGAEEIVETISLGKDKLAELGGVDEDTGEYKDPLAKAILEWRAAKQTIKSFLNIYTKFWYPESRIVTTGGLSFERVGDVPDSATKEELQRVFGFNDHVWVLHPNYNQTGAVTGRMTCSDPNLQQVASATTGLRKADIPARPRECFGPRPGCLWYLPDYSQVEVWLFAFMSGEKHMQELLLSGYDFHQGVAERSFTRKPDYEERKKYYRKLAKLIMFGKLYGGGVGTKDRPGRMTKLLQMPFEEAKAFIDSFEEQFREVQTYMKVMTNRAKREGVAWNPYGRKYVLGPEWAYKVVNYEVQGTAADTLKTATIRLDWMLERRWPDPRLGLVNLIHDEFMIEVPYELHCRKLMYEIVWVLQMDSAMLGIPVPLPVGMKIATKRWSTTKDITLPSWVKGGVPRGNQEHWFDSLQRDMSTCPH